jgi:predicted ATPase
MSDKHHPIVLFIDDLQWADEGSRLLISTLLEDEELRDVLFVLTYRDEEAERAESLLENRAEVMVDIQVGDLSLTAIESLLSYAMSSTSTASNQDFTELSKLVKLKTKGNPFHVAQYLVFVHSEGLLAFSAESNSWEFDIGDMQQQTMVPDSLVEIIELRMNRLQPHVLKTLMLAAFLGFRFEERVLVDVMARFERQKGQESTPVPLKKDSAAPNKAVKNALNMAVQEGIIEVSNTPGFYLFSHDKLLSSFCTRNHEEHGDDVAAIHFVLAQSFVDLKGVDEDEYYAYRAAEHANKAGGLFENRYGRSALAELNLNAARYCMKRSVFYAAAEYLREGVDLLDHEGTAWEQDYELCLLIHEHLSEVEMILGNFKACKVLANEVLYHVKSQESKVNALWNQISVKLAENEIVGSIQAGRAALRELGVPFPAKVNMTHIGRKLFRIKRMLRTKSDSDMLQLPVLDGTCKIAIHRILVHIAVMSMMEDQEKYAVYAALIVMEKTLEEGLTKFSSTGLAIYAVAEASLANYDSAYRYGQLALALAKTFKCVESESATTSLLGLAVLHWKMPVGDLVQPLARAFTSCFSVGNLWYGTLASSNSLLASLASGGNLIDLDAQSRYYLARFTEYNQEQLAFWILPIQQCILNLTSSFEDWRDATTMTGEVIVESDFFEFCDRTNYRPLRGSVLTLKLILAYHFKYYDVAEQVLKQLTSSAKVMRLHYLYYTYHFYGGMSYLALYREKRKRK